MKFFDPVCNVFLDTLDEELQAPHGNHIHYFCSPTCRKIYEEALEYEETIRNPLEFHAGGREKEPYLFIKRVDTGYEA